MKKTAGLVTGFVAVAVLAGCAPSQEQISLAKAMSMRTDRQPTYVESARFLHSRYVAPHDKDYVMWAMDYASICVLNGSFDEARDELLKCHLDIEQHQDTDKEKAAAISNEAMKLFKGEPFERAMVCCYLGLLHYVDGDYNNARVFFTRANMADATTEDDCKEFRGDFGLAHWGLGRAYLKLGQTDNATVAFRKAAIHIVRKGEEQEAKNLQAAQKRQRDSRMRLEKAVYEQARAAKPPVEGAADMSASSSIAEMPAVLPAWTGRAGPNPVELAADKPETFYTVDFQKDVNLVLVIETGLSPIKVLVGENQCMDQILRAPYAERQVMVYVDGHKAGLAFQAVDLFHQADTRGTSEKDRAQLAKGIAQSILRRLPYVGSLAAYWDVRADGRYWNLMPGEAHVFAARVKPGTHTVSVQCFDSNGHLLPRYSVTRHYLPVRAEQESVYVMHVKPEADNVYFPPKK